MILFHGSIMIVEQDKTAVLWDPKSGSQLATLKGHTQAPRRWLRWPRSRERAQFGTSLTTPQACSDLVSAENEPSKVFVTPILQNYNTWSLYSQPSKAVTALAWQPLHLADSPMCAAP